MPDSGVFFTKSPHSPTEELPKVVLKKTDFSTEPSAYALYWLGHSSAILELDGVRVLIDPVLENAAPLPGIVSRYTASPIKRKELPDVDVVLITHDHYDHLEIKTIKSLRNRNTRFIVPLGVGARLLAHNPDYFRSYCTLHPDLIVSGHNHGGMIRIPGIGGVISPRLHPFPKYDYGVYESADIKTKMVVTAGCGMHSIHIRINNPPEMVVIDVNKM